LLQGIREITKTDGSSFYVTPVIVNQTAGYVITVNSIVHSPCQEMNYTPGVRRLGTIQAGGLFKTVLCFGAGLQSVAQDGERNSHPRQRYFRAGIRW